MNSKNIIFIFKITLYVVVPTYPKVKQAIYRQGMGKVSSEKQFNKH